MPVKVAVIGCGSIGQKRHIRELSENPQARITAVCDINAQRVAKTAKRLKAESYTDYRQLLAEADCDAVVVATPNKFHAPQTIDSLNAGKHVLVEKPMAGTRAEAKAMMKAAEKSGRYLMIGLNQRLMAPHVKAKEILDSGKLGKPLTFDTNFKHPGPDEWSADGARSWFFKKELAIMGVTGDLGVHKADLLRYLLGQEFVEVSAFVTTLHKRDGDTHELISVDDNACLLLKTDAGVIGTMSVSWTNYGGVEHNGTTIYCENGVLTIPGTKGVIVNTRANGERFYDVGQVSTNTRQVNSHVTETFVKCIQKKTPPTIDGIEGYKSLDVILTAMEAAEKRKRLPIGS